jgi:hypothetical protein
MDSDMVLSHIVIHGLFYAAAFNGYLLLMMVTTNPRVWVYSDDSDEIKAKIPRQTKAPDGKESNWVPTSADGKFFLLFRFYGPEPAVFDKSWQLNDLEKLK